MAKHAFLVEKMWYVVETEAGKEQAFINIIEKTIEHRSFKRCFFVKRERLRRQQERCCVYREILYPGYVFVDTEEPNAFCGEVERLQQFIGSPGKKEFSMHPVDEREQTFLAELLNGDTEDTIRLSPVQVNESGEITASGGAAGKFRDSVVKKRIRNRYVVIGAEIGERKMEVLVGIWVVGRDGDLYRSGRN